MKSKSLSRVSSPWTAQSLDWHSILTDNPGLGPTLLSLLPNRTLKQIVREVWKRILSHIFSMEPAACWDILETHWGSGQTECGECLWGESLNCEAIQGSSNCWLRVSSKPGLNYFSMCRYFKWWYSLLYYVGVFYFDTTYSLEQIKLSLSHTVYCLLSNSDSNICESICLTRHKKQIFKLLNF